MRLKLETQVRLLALFLTDMIVNISRLMTSDFALHLMGLFGSRIFHVLNLFEQQLSSILLSLTLEIFEFVRLNGVEDFLVLTVNPCYQRDRK